MNAIENALRMVCDDLERVEPTAPSLHFARGVLAATEARPTMLAATPVFHGSRALFNDKMPEIIADYEGGMTLTEVAEKHGRSYMTIQRRLIESGVTIRPRTRKIDVKAAEIIADYQAGYAVLDLSVKYGFGTSAVSALLRRNGVKAQKSGVAQKAGNTLRLKQDAAPRIERIMELRAQGKTGDQIGAEFGITRERVRQIVSVSGRMEEFRERPFSPEQLAILKEYETGSALHEVASKLGVSDPTVRKWLQRAGITIRHKIPRHSEETKRRAVLAGELYRQGKKGREIAEAIGCKRPDEVYRYLQMAGVKRNRRHVPLGAAS